MGCISLSNPWGTPPTEEHSTRLLDRSLTLGYDHFDTAARYGFGANEALIVNATGVRAGAALRLSFRGLALPLAKHSLGPAPHQRGQLVQQGLVHRLEIEASLARTDAWPCP